MARLPHRSLPHPELKRSGTTRDGTDGLFEKPRRSPSPTNSTRTPKLSGHMRQIGLTFRHVTCLTRRDESSYAPNTP